MYQEIYTGYNNQSGKSAGGFFGIEADEVTDSSNWEELGLVIRYLYNGEVTERLVCYIQCEGCTGREVCDEIIKLGVEPPNV